MKSQIRLADLIGNYSREEGVWKLPEQHNEVDEALFQECAGKDAKFPEDGNIVADEQSPLTQQLLRMSDVMYWQYATLFMLLGKMYSDRKFYEPYGLSDSDYLLLSNAGDMIQISGKILDALASMLWKRAHGEWNEALDLRRSATARMNLLREKITECERRL